MDTGMGIVGTVGVEDGGDFVDDCHDSSSCYLQLY